MTPFHLTRVTNELATVHQLIAYSPQRKLQHKGPQSVSTRRFDSFHVRKPTFWPIVINSNPCAVESNFVFQILQRAIHIDGRSIMAASTDSQQDSHLVVSVRRKVGFPY
ncbi:MAG: hypothetical protein EZS28_007951 [Streblomastix strix]|uniref:Uncharacterized protein n=1 Tax=Streblomastix strix TaxID=222440 RepID=A0A5J4WNJ6_9EUKA|nr:MAG: hypothetical protein EZS28_007951 [Streblomastix strix]